jgi:hypothetical protein
MRYLALKPDPRRGIADHHGGAWLATFPMVVFTSTTF